MPELGEFHEAFCQLIAAGELTQAECYIQARAKEGRRPLKNVYSAGVSASTLLREPQIRARIKELVPQECDLTPSQRRFVEEKVKLSPSLMKTFALTRQWVIDELVDNVKQAKSKAYFNLNAANKALEMLGKEIGMFVNRNEVKTNVHYVIRERPMEADEWIKGHADRLN